MTIRSLIRSPIRSLVSSSFGEGGAGGGGGGGAPPGVNITNQTIWDSVNTSHSIASYLLTPPGAGASDGRVQAEGRGIVTTNLESWIIPTAGDGLTYQARATRVSGVAALTIGTLSTWQALTATRQYSIARSGLGTDQMVFTMEIRRASDSVVVATATVTLNATNT